jgi:hypothetical protein
MRLGNFGNSRREKLTLISSIPTKRRGKLDPNKKRTMLWNITKFHMRQLMKQTRMILKNLGGSIDYYGYFTDHLIT